MVENKRIVFTKYDEDYPLIKLTNDIRFTLFEQDSSTHAKLYYGVVYVNKNGDIFNKTPWNYHQSDLFHLKDDNEVNDLINWLYDNLIFKKEDC